MAQRKLARFDLDEALLKRLNERKFITARDLLSKSEVELMQLLDLDRITLRRLLKTVSQGVAPAPVYFTSKRPNGFFATSLKALDDCLHGGLPSSTVTEIVGPAGCGKTQISLMLAVIATLPADLGGLGGEVIYLDTENAFSATRLVEIARTRHPAHFADPARLEALTKAIHVSFVQSTDKLLERLGALEEDIIQHNIKLVILDSVASLVRKEFRGNMAERTDILAREASLLKYLSASFNIPIVVTNQVTTRFDVPVGFEKNRRVPQEGAPDAQKNFVVAALGNTWSHAVNTRLIVEYVSAQGQGFSSDGQVTDLRKIKVTKSPIAPFATFLYNINETGIVLLQSLGQQAPEEYEDPFEMVTINSRTAVALEDARR